MTQEKPHIPASMSADPHSTEDKEFSDTERKQHRAKCKEFTRALNRGAATVALCWAGLHASISGYSVATAPPASTKVEAEARRQLGISGRLIANMDGESEVTPVDPEMTDSMPKHSSQELQACYMIPTRRGLIEQIPLKIWDGVLEDLGVKNDGLLSRVKKSYPSTFFSLSKSCSENVKLRGVDSTSNSGAHER